MAVSRHVRGIAVERVIGHQSGGHPVCGRIHDHGIGNQIGVVTGDAGRQDLDLVATGGDPRQVHSLDGGILIDRDVVDRIQRGSGVVFVPGDLVVKH